MKPRMTRMNADVQIHLVPVIRAYPRYPRLPRSFFCRNQPVTQAGEESPFRGTINDPQSPAFIPDGLESSRGSSIVDLKCNTPFS
jgi:hypothetical protein